MQESEKLIPLLNFLLNPASEISMGWRFDIGEWATFRQIKGSEQKFSINLTPTGSSAAIREDPLVNRYKTIGRFFIGYEPKK
ncbi:hypothetical protein EHF33_16355 (plasmid) [Deinococcus psychrotolerans]|uniref:Uncharacterized protein n=1 Tax=Deinococcus psychrotolerans TaxID=2489213 RepID=A0A3G8YJL2_9DEIO|nr:hypothetical protein [Deinococcus psychrotolerans]AZI44487.1 hypothetical protein EHF33_16355 [Deinococcus psychrotolerans]